MRVAFDVDDTLIIPSVALKGDGFYERTHPYDSPNYDTIAILRWFQAQGAEIVIWSGGGVDYATMWAEKLCLHPFTVRKKEKADDIDICFDDCVVDLAKVNVRVKRFNNGVSRKDWNEHEDFMARGG